MDGRFVYPLITSRKCTRSAALRLCSYFNLSLFTEDTLGAVRSSTTLWFIATINTFLQILDIMRDNYDL